MSQIDPQLLSTLLENVPVVTYVATFEERANVLYVSPQIERYTGRPPERFLGPNGGCWDDHVHPDDLERVTAAETKCFEERTTFDCEYRVVHLDGSVHHVWERDFLIRDAAGKPVYTQGILVDVTPQRAAEAAAQRYLDLPEVVMLALDRRGRVTMLNRAGHELLGYRDGELLGADWFPRFVPGGKDMLEPYGRMLAAGAIPPDQEFPLRRRDGSEVLVSWKMKVLPDGSGLLCSGTDVTARRQAQEQIEHMAYHDSLTGLPNRAMLRESLDTALARARRHGQAVALLYLDLDDFKLVNDGLGHAAGDELLRQVAGRLRERLRAEDVLAREGGDEFLVLLADLEDDAEERALALGEALVDALRPAYVVEATEFEINGSVGVSLFPRDGSDSETLLAHADAAMYEAKADGRGQVRLFRGHRTLSPERLGMGRRLRRAIEDGELTLHWQPIIDLATLEPKGAEALVRWNDPEHGLRGAGEFVPQMTAAGLLEPLDEWVAAEVTRQRREWQEAGEDPYVGFNLSHRSLDSHRVERILSLLTEGGMGLDRVTVEISEAAALDHDAGLRRLHEAGVTLALDDFGVAYSSLSRLRDLPTAWIKVDRSFLAGVPADPRATRVLDALLRLLEALGCRTIVEGVETREQLEHLRTRRCDAAQGYLLGVPAPASELWIATALPRSVAPGG